ncbi:MAG: S-layer homology domain-containing protein [Eubacteriales bacterium]|nr:S-layer homology domain-containing protein [Eubacteriales bacterium]MDD3199382.1 S-layer homology domain-containing protein [Eubacteriales bacterium]
MRRRTLSLLLVFSMLFALLPATASAEPSTGVVNLETAGSGRIEKISGEQADIVWNGTSGTQTLALETIDGHDLMNAHYNIVSNAGYRIKSVTLYSIGEDTVAFDLDVTSGEGGFYGRVLDGGNRLIAGSVRWLAKDGDKLTAEFENTSASRETVTVEGERGLLLAQTMSGVNKIEVKDTFSVSGSMTISKDTEIRNGTVTIDSGVTLNINGCDFGPDFSKAVTNPSKLINNGTISVNDGGSLFMIDENNGSIIIKSGGAMESGVLNSSCASIVVKSGGEARCAMGGNIQNAGQYTVDSGGVLKPQKGAGFRNFIGADAGTLTLNGDMVFDQDYWSDFSQGTLLGSGRFVINFRIGEDDLGDLQSAVAGTSLQIVNESVVELDSSADYAAFKEAVTGVSVRAIYLTNASININEDLSITDKTIYLEGATALTLNAGRTLTLTDASGNGTQCGLTNVIDHNENYIRPATSFVINGRLVLVNSASVGGYIGTVTIGSGGIVDNRDGSLDVRYTVYCNGTITNMDYTDRADDGNLRIFTNGILVKDGTAILGEQSGSIDAAQADAAVSGMSISRKTELLDDTVYEDPNPTNTILIKDLTIPKDTLLWVPDLATYENYVNIGNTNPGTGNASLTLDSGRTLTIESGAALRLNGPFINNGTVYYNGSISGEGAIGGGGLFVLAPNTTVKITTGGGMIRGANDNEAIATVSGRGYTVGSDGRLITSHSIYAADNMLDLGTGSGIEGLMQNGAALAPPVGLAQAAVATAGLNTSDNYAAKLEVDLQSIAENNGTTLVYDIKPKISANGGSWADIAALEGNSENNTAVSFRLPVPADTEENYVRIVHKNGETIKSIDFYQVLTDVAGNKYAEISTKSFSTFEMSFTDSNTVSSGGNGGGGGTSPSPVTGGDVTSITAEIKSSSTGTSAVATVAEATMTKVIDAALEAAARDNNSANINIVVDAPMNMTEIKTTIPKASIDKLAGEDSSVSLTVTTPVGSITFDSDALSSIGEAAAGTNVTLTVARVSKEGLTSEQQTLVGDRPVIDLSVMSNGKLISDFAGGSATASIPYTLAEGESADGIVVWYLADDGTLAPVECNYQDGRLTFKTDHFSQYVLAYFPFDDLNGGEWYYKNVAYAYTNDLMNGVGNSLFNPSGTTTRGMVVTILWRREGEPVLLRQSFTDVADGMWYAGAVSWAAANGIAIGYNGRFNPEAAITREQMAAIVYRYAAYKGYDVSGLNDLSAFNDAAGVSGWAETAMKWAVKNNILNGVGNSELDPAGIAQRAQAAAILQRFIENISK